MIPAAAQCNLSLNNSAGGSNPGGTLTVSSSGSTIQRIRWYKDGSLIQTEEATWNASGTVIHTFSSGSAGGLWGYKDTVYIADFWGNSILKWWPGLASAVIIFNPGGTQGGPPSAANQPNGLYIDPDNNLYLSEWSGRRTSKFNPAPTAAAATLTLRAGDGGYQAGGIFVLNDTAYVPRSSVSAISPNTIGRFVPGTVNPGTTILTGVTDIGAVRMFRDSFYVLANNAVRRFSRSSFIAGGITFPGGTLVVGTGIAGSALDQLNNPQGLFLDLLGNIYLGDYGNNRVVRWAPGATQGVIVAGTGTAGSGLNELNIPTNVWISINGKLYVLDNGNNRLLEYAPVLNNGLAGATPGVYKAVTNGFNGCLDSVSITIGSPAPAQPGLFTAAPASVCQGQNNVTYAVPVVSGATSYEWVYSGLGVTFSGTSSTAAPTNDLSFSGSATGGMLRVRAVNGAGAGPYRDTVITVNAVPAQPGAYTASSASVCQGQNNVTYTVPTVSGATTYEWSYTGGGATFSGTSSTASPTNTVNFSGSATGGNIQVSAKNSCGTSAARSVTVTVGSVPAQPGAYTASSASVCQGQDNVTYTVPAVSGATTYEWSYTGGGATFSGTSSTASPTNTVNFSGSATDGSISVSAKNTCGTSTARSVAVTVNVPPVATVSPAGPVDICEDDSVTLTAGSGTSYSYQWKNGGAPAGTGGSTYAARTTGDYKVVVSGPGGCSDSTQAVSVTVYNRPAVSLVPGDTAFCEGGIVILQVSPHDTGLTYLWKNGNAVVPLASAYFLEINGTGVYRVIVGRSSVGNCVDSTNEVMVTVHPLPVADISWDYEMLHATPGYVSYQWNTGSQGIAGATDSTFRPASAGGYSVTVTDSNGCSGTSPVYNVTVGVEDVSPVASQVRVYPNPSDGMVHIVAPVSVGVSLHGMDGRVLQRHADVNSIDMSGYAEGVYLLRITGSDGTVIRTERLIRQHTR